jgi:dolichol-phosphate mannosyltransferase
MMSICDVSIVVPCFNEQEVLPQTLQRLHTVARQLALRYEIVLVDDGSTDQTWELISHAHGADPETIKGVRFARNFGHQAALTAGLSRARGESVMIIDADLQDPPELLGSMLAKQREGYDVVYGQRRQRAGETWFKIATAALFYRLIGSLSEIEIPPDTGDFRVMSRRAVDAFLELPENSRFIRGMVAWIGFPQYALPYDREKRAAGATKYTVSKMLRFSVDAITSFSIRPLRIAIFASALLIVAAASLMVWAFIVKAQGDTVRGWASLIVTILFVGAIQTLILGIIGEYVGRIFIEAKKRPLYLVRSTLGTAEKTSR